RAADRDPLANAAEGDGMRVGQHLLATSGAMAARRRVAAAPRPAPRRITPAWPTRSRPRDRRQCLGPRTARGKKTGPNPTDRRKAGSKHHILTEAQGIPLAAIVTAATRHDVHQLLPSVNGIPAFAVR